jgi:CDP-diacylglycerol--glycerol-3-phosphate 3-phosphatidyltransferase
MGWANRITVARALLTLALHALLTVSAPAPSAAAYGAATVLFLVTALTDVVDGAIARFFGDVSVFGRIADPFVDKLLIVGTLIFLVGMEGLGEVLPAWAVVLILARELLVTALRAAVEARGEAFGAAAWGKAKMFFQSAAVLAVLLHGAGVAWVRADLSFLGGLPGAWGLARALVWVAALVTAVSGIEYAWRAARLLRRA